MEFSKEEKELLKFCVELSIQCMNKVPARLLKRKKTNKVLMLSKLNQLFLKFKDIQDVWFNKPIIRKICNWLNS